MHDLPSCLLLVEDEYAVDGAQGYGSLDLVLEKDEISDLAIEHGFSLQHAMQVNVPHISRRLKAIQVQIRRLSLVSALHEHQCEHFLAYFGFNRLFEQFLCFARGHEALFNHVPFLVE